MYIGMKEKQKRLSLSFRVLPLVSSVLQGFSWVSGLSRGLFSPRVLWVSEGVPRGSLGSLVVPWGF